MYCVLLFLSLFSQTFVDTVEQQLAEAAAEKSELDELAARYQVIPFPHTSILEPNCECFVCVGICGATEGTARRCRKGYVLYILCVCVCCGVCVVQMLKSVRRDC